ncbi:MAG: hypothetical protein M1450_00885 [Patescibacteria group bacterium]|nr:hypothetical protein [Patescibacteria group bacterium]
MINKIKNFLLDIKNKLPYKRFLLFIKKKPLTSFFITLLILIILIVAGNVLGSKKTTTEKTVLEKKVNVYKIGTAPRIDVQAKIEKSSVIKINALAGGVIDSINISEGDFVEKGTNLINMATNYAGGNALLIQAAIAEEQLKSAKDTYPIQKDQIQKKRDLVKKTEEDLENLRNISEQSISETQNLLNLDQDILNTIDTNIKNLEATNTATSSAGISFGTNDEKILGAKQLKSQFQIAINGLNQALRNTQYSSSDTNPPAEKGRFQRDIDLEQLDIQEKSLDINLEITKLQASLAEVNAELMHPMAPFSGKIQRIYVREGQAVNPGTPLLLLAGDSNVKKTTAVALVSENIARNVSQIEPSHLYFGNISYYEHPFFVSCEATDNQLFSIQYLVPDGYEKTLADGEYITVNIPVGYPDTNYTVPYVPIDAIYQSQDQAFLFVIQNGKAVSKIVKLGQVYGKFVEIQSGLKAGDKVILNRNVIAGDKVSPIY